MFFFFSLIIPKPLTFCHMSILHWLRPSPNPAWKLRSSTTSKGGIERPLRYCYFKSKHLGKHMGGTFNTEACKLLGLVTCQVSLGTTPTCEGGVYFNLNPLLFRRVLNGYIFSHQLAHFFFFF